MSRPSPRSWTNIIVSRDTLALVEQLQELVGQADPLGEVPSKHRTVALAVRRMIDDMAREASRGNTRDVDVQKPRRRRRI
jgi:hypothetical protein